ncbi:MAG: glycosyltransferase family 2 protein [Rhodospirillales bacterium]|nr:glycosyltransferase family 2 protein [Rhodospirillales bacterium]
MAQAEPRVTILLSTYNGARFLAEQLDSLLAQSHANWRLLWRDDGSQDATRALMEDFAARLGPQRCVELAQPAGRMRATGSFLALLRAAAPELGPAELVAFADQDDVWLPEKLARGAAALGDMPTSEPALYCARQMLVDAALRPLGLSHPLDRPVAFPAALAQNVTTGCTIMMNAAAARLVADSEAPPATLHDWWCYLVVTARGGRMVCDAEAVVQYRQHKANLVGAPRSKVRRAWAAIGRGPSVFMNVLRQHVAALAAQPHLLSPGAARQVAALDRALKGGMAGRLTVLRLPGLRRQTWQETALFWLWFVIG